MTTAQKMRQLALAMPKVLESSHFGQPDFRVAGKIFATLSRDELLGCVKLERRQQLELLESRGETFFAAKGAWGFQGWTHFHLEKIDGRKLKSLLQVAWNIIAPKQARASTPKTKAPKTKAPKTKKRRAVKARST
jgi:hypothetical protein